MMRRLPKHRESVCKQSCWSYKTHLEVDDGICVSCINQRMSSYGIQSNALTDDECHSEHAASPYQVVRQGKSACFYSQPDEASQKSDRQRQSEQKHLSDLINNIHQ